MKKLAYIYDHVFYEHRGLIYSSGAFTVDTWSRFDAWDEIQVFAFICPVESASGLNRASSPNIKFENIHRPTESVFHLLLSRWIFKREIKDKILMCDDVVLRVPGEASFIIAGILNQLDRPYGLEVVGCPWDAYWNQGMIGKLLAFSRYRLMKRIVFNASAAVYVTSDFLQKRYPCNSMNTSISNVELGAYDPNNRLKQNKAYINISHIGNYNVKYKGHNILIKAIAELPKDVQKRIRIYFIGSGSSYRLKKLIGKYDIKSKIIFTGKLKLGVEVYQYLNSSDLYIQTSYQEGLPRAVIEAMNARCFVIASSAGGTYELIPSNYIYRPGDYRHLASLLRLYLQLCKKDIHKLCSIQSQYVELKFEKNKLSNERKEFWSKYSIRS